MMASIGKGEGEGEKTKSAGKKDDDWGADDDDDDDDVDGKVTFEDLLAGLNDVKNGSVQKHIKDLADRKPGGNDIGEPQQFMSEAK